MRQGPIRSDWVLVGGGHAHVQVLRRFAMRPLEGVRLSLVVDRAEAVYSGMVPGLVAGDYRPCELEIDCVPLARRAGARVVLASALKVDPARRRVHLEGRPPIAYDLASLDVGSGVRGLELPGVREHALATRPIRDFIDRLGERLARARTQCPGRALRLGVVGAGAAGVELAFTLRSRLEAEGGAFEMTLLGEGAEPLSGSAPRVAARVRRELDRRGIRWRGRARVEAVEKDALVLADARLACDLAVWATGASPQPLGAASGLALDERGFVRVGPTLQVVGEDDLFAVGDCAALDDHAWVPKAGVYAVRQGPVLDANLRARSEGRALRAYRPQRDFLALLNLGGGEALASKWGLCAVGRWVGRWKDRIDRGFMEKFQVLDEVSGITKEFSSMGGMGKMGGPAGEPMECGGCAAKLAAPRLGAALGRIGTGPPDDSVLLGLAQPDDAAAWRQAGGVAVGTVDAFPAFTDDPWLVGRAAAVNAVSDVYAVGARPGHAMAFVSIPEEEGARAEEMLFQVLSGVRAALDPLGVSLVGGHTTRGPELQVGLSVHGALADDAAPLTLGGLAAGQALVLTKALGTGVLLAADMQGRLPGRWLPPLHASLLRPNAEAARVARAVGARGATDVSGFGLAHHLLELLRESGVAARLDLAKLPALPGARELLAQGLRSSFHAQNTPTPDEIALGGALRGRPEVELLFDPQTSGGLLFGVPRARALEAVAQLHDAGDASAAVVGEVEPAATDGPAAARLRIVED
ncbi:MAG: selenide, water dikinase SelD [Myxococcota bacterium]